MEDIARLVDRYIAKAENMVEFCRIVCNPQRKAEAQALKSDITDLQRNLNDAKRFLDVHQSKTMQEVRAALHELRRQEVIMKLVLARTGTPQKQEEPQSDYLTPTRPIRNAVPQSSVKKIQWDKRTTSYQPPPPSTGKKTGARNIQLEHFSYSITEKEFNTIPKYLRTGREQMADLQRCLDEIICPCLIDKYTILNKATNDLANVNQRQLQRLFRDQESYFPGHFFITEGDIARFMNTLIDKKMRNRIMMLRQLGLIKEVRKNSSACYMWMIRVEE